LLRSASDADLFETFESASEMTYIVSSGALNSTHSLETFETQHVQESVKDPLDTEKMTSVDVPRRFGK